MCIVLIQNKKVIFIPNFSSTKQGHELNHSERRQEFCFCGGSEKRHLECLNKGEFENFSSIFLRRHSSLTSMLFTMVFTWLFNSQSCSVRCKPAVPKTRPFRRTSSKYASCCSLNASSISRNSSRTESSFYSTSKRSILKQKCLY